MKTKVKCKKCGVFVSDIKRHKERERCEAVENRRLYRSDIKKSGDKTKAIKEILGSRGERTARRQGKTTNKKTRGNTK